MSTRNKGFLLLGLLIALLLAGVASYYASSAPDGLNKVAADQGLDSKAKPHASDDSPLAGYAAKGVDNDRLSGGVAGIAGVAVTFALAGGVAYAVRRRGPAGAAPAGEPDDALTGRRP